MQLEGMLLLLIMIIIIPVLSIFSNDTAFFIILSLVLSFSSMNKILNPFLPISNDDDDDETKELIEEVKESTNLDFHKLKSGLKTAKALVIILYFIYSSFFMELFIYKVATSFIIVYWIHYIVETIKNNSEDENIDSNHPNSTFDQFLSIIVNAITLILILITIYTRFFR